MKKYFGILVVIALIGTAVPAAAQTAAVSAIHAIPGQSLGLAPSLPVDVYATLNGGTKGKLLTFEYKQIVGPVDVPTGTYLLEVFPAGTDPSGTPLLDLTVDLEPGGNYTVIAHLTYKGGNPPDPGFALSAFLNNLDSICRGRTRLAIRHTANAPEVDVKLQRGLNGVVAGIFPGLSNPDDVGPGEVSAAVLLGGGYSASLLVEESAVFKSDLLVLKPRRAYNVYAIGDFFAGTFELLTQVFIVPDTVPSNQCSPGKMRHPVF
jgi:hypothetical protein